MFRRRPIYTHQNGSINPTSYDDSKLWSLFGYPKY